MSVASAGIGLANLLNQIHRTHVVKGFDFNLMVAGDYGLGKSTFINMLFGCDIYEKVPYSKFSQVYPNECNITSSVVKLSEKGVELNLEVIDITGFGYAIDNQIWDHLNDFITKRMNEHIEHEVNQESESRRDSRIHCCFYFLPPTGHGLRPADIRFMQSVHKMVNLIPIIAKADSLTIEELAAYKARIRESFKTNNIQIYKFPQLFDEQDEEDTYKKIDIENLLPLAIVSSNDYHNINGKRCLARKYPWGYIEIYGNANFDTSLLKDLFLKTHMYHLIHSSVNVIYENYRTAYLNNIDIEFVEKMFMSRLSIKSKEGETGEKSDGDGMNDQRIQEIISEAQSNYLMQLESLKNQYKQTIEERKTTIESLNRQITLRMSDNYRSSQENSYVHSPSSNTDSSSRVTKTLRRLPTNRGGSRDVLSTKKREKTTKKK